MKNREKNAKNGNCIDTCCPEETRVVWDNSPQLLTSYRPNSTITAKLTTHKKTQCQPQAAEMNTRLGWCESEEVVR